MEKLHIELIMENEEHLSRIKHLEKIFESKIYEFDYIDREFRKILDNYYVDHSIDKYSVIEDGLEIALGHGNPALLISAIEDEQERRKKRKRKTK
jgi:hypothetical protein